MLTKVISLFVCLLFLAEVHAQNFSGLESKKLNRSEDLSSLLETGIGSLFGNKLKGSIDSVVVKQDAERTLRVLVYYQGYEGGFFTVSTLDPARKKQDQFDVFQFAQTEKASPAECVINMRSGVADNVAFESGYLRIDVGKKKGSVGNVSAFTMNKKWQSTVNNKNIIVPIKLVAVGKAGSLTSEKKDVTPGKTIQFDPKLIYINPTTIKTMQPVRTSGGNSFMKPIVVPHFDDNKAVSGTWVNTDNNTSGLTKLIITNENQIQVFKRCNPQDCDWGKVALNKTGPASYKAVYGNSLQTQTVLVNEQTDGSLNVVHTESRKMLGVSSTTKTYTFKKNLNLVLVSPAVFSIKTIATMPATGSATDKTAKGPDKNRQFYLLDGLSADVDFRRPQDISNININVFADKNINSGVYYIMPADYHLLWTPKSEPEKGYDFRILYGSQSGSEEDAEAPVRMSATLTAGISSREREFVKELLKSVRSDFKELRYLPLRDNPQFTFQSTLGAQYNIPEAKVTTEKITDLSGDIRVAWQTDANTKEEILAAITAREGIAASVILKPEDEEIIDQQIPAIINLAEIRTLGKMSLQPNLWRTKNWKNETPYPLKMNYIHVLKKQVGGSDPIIYSWSLGGTVVPSQAQATFEAAKIPSWIDNEPSVVMWVDYSIEDCGKCDAAVMNAVTGGVSGTRSQQVLFTVPPAMFDTLKADQIMITVRSIQGDPKAAEMKEFTSVKLKKDANEGAVGPFYVSSGSSLQYEFRITVIASDGEVYKADRWISSGEKEFVIPKSQLKELFKNIIPGLN